MRHRLKKQISYFLATRHCTLDALGNQPGTKVSGPPRPSPDNLLLRDLCVAADVPAAGVERLEARWDGMDRGSAAKIGGMDRQTLRDWVHRFNAAGPGGLVDNWTAGLKPRLSEEQRAQFAQIVEAGPDRGAARWAVRRRVPRRCRTPWPHSRRLVWTKRSALPLVLGV